MSELKRGMGLFHLTMYGVGLILGAGIYVLIGEAAGFAGDSVWIAFVLGSIVALFAGLSYAELSSIFPKAAAEYTFVKNAFKNNFFAFIIGWLTAITSMIMAATVALGFGGYFSEFLNIPIVISAIALIGILSIINFRITGGFVSQICVMYFLFAIGDIPYFYQQTPILEFLS